MKEIKFCNRCIMNNISDDSISFDKDGLCNYCAESLRLKDSVYFPNDIGKRKLELLLNRIKNKNKYKKYDCVIGISGGIDSSYLAYLGYKWGLRILAVHIDDGYDTKISIENIEKLCDKANIELRIIKPDKLQYNSLLLAYMKAGVPNLAIPQDNILVSFLYETVRKEKLSYFLSGGNFALESILQKSHTFSSLDLVNLYDINKKFGDNNIDKLSFISSYKKYLYMKLGIVKEYRPLNFIDYNLKNAFKELYDFCGFTYYGRKHLENKLTTFLQLYWLPKKFNVDKRYSHYSSMIISGQLTRNDALKEVDKSLYENVPMNEIIDEIIYNVGINKKQFDVLMNSPIHEHLDYEHDKIDNIVRKILLKR